MPTSRSASALLLCLALSAFAIMIGYAFLRSATRQAMAGREETLVVLAQQAARSGLAHAMEQVMEEYQGAPGAAPVTVHGRQARSLSLATGSNAEVKVAATLTPTFLDGPWRAPFTAISNPQSYNSSGWDDTQAWNHLWLPLVPSGSTKWHCFDPVYPSPSGTMIADGRGRFVEVEYHNLTRPSPAVATPLPIVPGSGGASPKQIAFTDLTTAYATVEREQPLCLDSDLRPLSGGTAAQRRQQARYRLRYALNIEDLNGHLLVNPLANMNTDWTDPANDYRNWDPAGQAHRRPWLDHAGYVLANMAACWPGNLFDGNGGGRFDRAISQRVVAARMQHVFSGRGSASNADRAWTPGLRSGLPATFPMMFRAGEANITVRGDWAASIPITPTNWFASFVAANTDLYLNFPQMGGPLYGFDATQVQRAAPATPADVSSVYESIRVNPHGGEIITPVVTGSLRPLTPNIPYTHSLMGPQYSWMNWFFANVGHSAPANSGELNSDGRPLEWIYVNSTDIGFFLFPYSLYGRRLERTSGFAPDTARWYQGRVDTPWQVNLLTAAPITVSQMLLAYLHPELRNTGRPYASNDYLKNLQGMDILTDQLGAGFASFPAPSSSCTDPLGVPVTVKPDYYQNDIAGDPLIDPKPAPFAGVVPTQATSAYPEPVAADNRPIASRYPGILCRGDSSRPGKGCTDDLGKDIDVDGRSGLGSPVDAKPAGHCSHTGSTTYGRLPNMFVQFWRTSDARARNGSYFWDLTYAMASAIGIAKATWVQYPNASMTPSIPARFNPVSLRDPLAYDTLAEIDALFLRQLGENFAAPGTPAASNPILCLPSSGVMNYSVSASAVSNTIASLVSKDLLRVDTTDETGAPVTYTSAQRGAIMERMLNDYRMSFLGSSPFYHSYDRAAYDKWSDDPGREEFRPLDFDGNGQVHCSGYASSGIAAEIALGLDRHQPAVGSGRGPDPVNWFSATGCFYLGKSHFYRVMIRGEVFDALANRPVSQQHLESVICVDPEAPLLPAADRRTDDLRVLFQRWHQSDFNGELPRQTR